MNLDGLSDSQIEAFFGNPAPAASAQRPSTAVAAPVARPVRKDSDDKLFGSDENDGEDLFGDSPSKSKPTGKGYDENEEEEEEDDRPQKSLKDMLSARLGVKPPPVKPPPPAAPPASAADEEDEENEDGDLFAVDKDDPHSLFGGPPVTKAPGPNKSKRDSLATLFGDAESSLFGEPAAPPPPMPVAEKPKANLSSLFGALDSDDGGLFDTVSSTASKVQQESVAVQKSLFNDEPAPPVVAPPAPAVNKRGSVSTMSSADLFGSGLFDNTSEVEDSLFSGGATKSSPAAALAAPATTSGAKSNLSNLFGDDGDSSSLFSEPKKPERKPSITTSK
jgi:hypothetical protein